MSPIFNTHLTGCKEVPPVRTRAIGTFEATVNEDVTSLFYILTVHDMKRVIAAHLHQAKKGVNGPIVVFLFGCATGPTTHGISVNCGVVKGTITAANLIGPLQGQPLSALINLINSGDIYANVHTEKHPSGEIRGQVRSN